ncbi:ligase-associated DNA damage response endonuclease PdeM [Rhodopirellula sallentina]|uniref:ICC-like putative phosphoesterase n=1 Tax=Rhodopirellula sallentina SM41 TaxID=1263870 RepID=M5TST5_9BACT|nr:ligase-associated DNA damage response endonuclease PdeM [Rhodopirellula sallentina]EMI52247.1 ICC-like putative phosphoesterase [Rhodopirellula sallentina SM41]
MANRISIKLNGIEVCLHSDGSVEWPDRQTLFIADPHFGKEATFRRHGIPVPMGSTQGTLQKIQRRVCETGVSRLVILGDMFHARSSLSRDVVESIEDFFSAFIDLSTVLVRGNHDAHVGQLPSSWPIEIVDPFERIDDLVMTHHPEEVPEDARVLLCGHVHPAVKVGDAIGKLPCFFYRNRMLMLPAIGQFTGTHVVKINSGDLAWAIAENEVFPVHSERP